MITLHYQPITLDDFKRALDYLSQRGINAPASLASVPASDNGSATTSFRGQSVTPEQASLIEQLKSITGNQRLRSMGEYSHLSITEELQTRLAKHGTEGAIEGTETLGEGELPSLDIIPD